MGKRVANMVPETDSVPRIAGFSRRKWEYIEWAAEHLRDHNTRRQFAQAVQEHHNAIHLSKIVYKYAYELRLIFGLTN